MKCKQKIHILVNIESIAMQTATYARTIILNGKLSNEAGAENAFKIEEKVHAAWCITTRISSGRMNYFAIMWSVYSSFLLYLLPTKKNENKNKLPRPSLFA